MRQKFCGAEMLEIRLDLIPASDQRGGLVRLMPVGTMQLHEVLGKYMYM
jgi:hypothetical protein